MAASKVRQAKKYFTEYISSQSIYRIVLEKIRGEGSTIYSGVTVAFHVFTGPYILHDESFYIDHSRIISAEIIFADIVDLYIFDNLTNIVLFFSNP